jgi:hypothetical protein
MKIIIVVHHVPSGDPYGLYQKLNEALQYEWRTMISAFKLEEREESQDYDSRTLLQTTHVEDQKYTKNNNKKSKCHSNMALIYLVFYTFS